MVDTTSYMFVTCELCQVAFCWCWPYLSSHSHYSYMLCITFNRTRGCQNSNQWNSHQRRTRRCLRSRQWQKWGSSWKLSQRRCSSTRHEDLIDYLPSSNDKSTLPERPITDDHHRLVPTLDRLVPDDPNQPYDMRDIIREIIDYETMFEIQLVEFINWFVH
jgi:hypothetical protein